jgi:hypothetical protein
MEYQRTALVSAPRLPVVLGLAHHVGAVQRQSRALPAPLPGYFSHVSYKP